MALLGLFCMIYPMTASAAINIVIGVAFILGGVFTLFGCPKNGDAWHKALYIIISLLFAFVGFMMIVHPYKGIVALTLVLGIEFLVQGFYTLLHWIKSRRNYSTSILLLLNAIILIVLGVILISDPRDNLWMIGFFAGINFLFTGITIYTLRSK